jgi:excisionase family DNA binding protein
MDKLVYSVKETAQVLNIGMNAAYNLVNSKSFPKITLGRKILVPKKALEQWLDTHSITA